MTVLYMLVHNTFCLLPHHHVHLPEKDLVPPVMGVHVTLFPASPQGIVQRLDQVLTHGIRAMVVTLFKL